ncbi:Glucose-6-phosphate isomerase [Posidoniimonas polymericola]|uniref:Glucose-6-phosphate isomerase n=1 Tax=Posidoniimonas polymericola TaxID=2528002 RepID=A0A5C5YS13_9BACT|nr:glucose-6-phosphate isomerase [Posidoniimonas polymericola]TWT77487.1 Glucose-6-phosphate isomerase [Posidoniimonas polymericola]
MSTSIRYNPAGTFLKSGGISAADLEALAPKLHDAREEVLADAQLWADGVDVPDAKQPLDAGFHLLPDRLLQELKDRGADSEVARLKATADRLAGSCASVVVLGIGGSYMGARALAEACCHPYYNEVPPAMRGGRPKIFYEGNNVDNDAAQGLLDVLGSDTGQWGVVVISKSGGTLETAAATRIMIRELKDSLSGDEKLADYFVPVTGTSGKLFDLSKALGCQEIYEVPDGVGGRFSVLSAVGLLPAAVMGLDIEKLLQGAADMNEHFASAKPGENVVLDYVGVCHLLEEKQGCDIRILSTWGKKLEALGLWYDQLLAESLGKHEKGALPLTIVNTRDLHSRGQQHQEGKRDKLITNVIIESADRDPLAIGESDNNQDQLNELADKTLPNILSAAIAGTNQAYLDDNRPTADLVCPQLDEYVMGQLFQMFMLATVVEGRMIGVNPYGQPGVEAYKRNMNAILRS